MLVFDDADGTPPPAVIPPVPSAPVQVRSGALLALPLQRQAGGAFRLTVIT
jgi:hypothetical protein